MIHYFKSRPRILTAISVGALCWWCLPDLWYGTTRFLCSWDVSIALYLLLVGVMMARSDTQQMKTRAAETDEGAFVILAMTVFTCAASIMGILGELSTAKEIEGASKGVHIALTGLTVILSWAFMHTMFALHYAHEFYDEEKGELVLGLRFPKDSHDDDYQPDYWDFVYYAFIIGTAAQTADVSTSSAEMRRMTTVHCILAFFFNTTILALMINISASLI